jgi:hypothetical protein
METGPQSENCAFKIGVALISRTYCMLLTCFIEIEQVQRTALDSMEKNKYLK